MSAFPGTPMAGPLPREWKRSLHRPRASGKENNSQILSNLNRSAFSAHVLYVRKLKMEIFTLNKTESFQEGT